MFRLCELLDYNRHEIFVLALLIFFSFNLYSQNLYLSYWDNDQKDEHIKNFEIHDNEEIRIEKRVQAKS